MREFIPNLLFIYLHRHQCEISTKIINERMKSVSGRLCSLCQYLSISCSEPFCSMKPTGGKKPLSVLCLAAKLHTGKQIPLHLQCHPLNIFPPCQHLKWTTNLCVLEYQRAQPLSTAPSLPPSILPSLPEYFHDSTEYSMYFPISSTCIKYLSLLAGKYIS